MRTSLKRKVDYALGGRLEVRTLPWVVVEVGRIHCVRGDSDFELLRVA
jgi:hypothetical protein